MIDFKGKLEENSLEIDRFLDHNLPFGNGLNAKLFEAMRSVSYTHLTLPTTPYV